MATLRKVHPLPVSASSATHCGAQRRRYVSSEYDGKQAICYLLVVAGVPGGAPDRGPVFHGQVEDGARLRLCETVCVAGLEHLGLLCARVRVHGAV